MNEYPNTELQRTISGFPGVWQRVTQSENREPGRTDPGRNDLPVLIRGEAMAALEDSRLARQMRSPARRLLMEHAAAARRRCRRLQAEEYIQNGRQEQTGVRLDSPKDRLQALRGAYQRDLAAAREYEQAARCAEDSDLRELLLRFARERENAAREKRALLVACFGR